MNEAQALAQTLSGKRILVVEDQYLIASDLHRALETMAAVVVGPASTGSQGLALLDGDIDAAILDVNLRGGTSLAIAEQLAKRAIPYLFLTGKDNWALPETYREVPRVLKPYRMGAVVECLNRIIRKDRS